MFIELDQHHNFLVVAGKGSDLKRHVVQGRDLKKFIAEQERVVYIGKLECFECYTKDPKTGRGGWDIVYIYGVKEAIQKRYPNFDCFITKDYPSDKSMVVSFYSIWADDYPMA